MANEIPHLLAEQCQKVALEKEMELVRQVQQAMLPPATLDAHGRYKLVGSCMPASQCGGDWWMYRKLSGGRLLLVLGDASLDASQGTAREVKVTATVANVRARPAPSGKLLFQLKQGETARLVETAGDWHHVEDAQGRRGYVLGTLVQVVEPPPPPPAPEPTPPPAAEPAPGPGPLTIDHKEIGCLVAEQYPKLDACFAPEENVGRAQIHFRALDSNNDILQLCTANNDRAEFNRYLYPNRRRSSARSTRSLSRQACISSPSARD